MNIQILIATINGWLHFRTIPVDSRVSPKDFPENVEHTIQTGSLKDKISDKKICRKTEPCKSQPLKSLQFPGSVFVTFYICVLLSSVLWECENGTQQTGMIINKLHVLMCVLHTNNFPQRDTIGQLRCKNKSHTQLVQMTITPRCIYLCLLVGTDRDYLRKEE